LSYFIGMSSVLLFLSTGCSLKQIAIKSTSEILNDGLDSFESESDPILAREAAASQIKLLEALHRGDPTNEEVLLLLTRSLASYAFGFLEMEAEKNVTTRSRAAQLYDRATSYGLLLLDRRLGKGTSNLARSGSTDDWVARISQAKKSDVESIFWTGYAWAG